MYYVIMNVANQNQSHGKSELRYYFIRPTIYNIGLYNDMRHVPVKWPSYFGQIFKQPKPTDPLFFIKLKISVHFAHIENTFWQFYGKINKLWGIKAIFDYQWQESFSCLTQNHPIFYLATPKDLFFRISTPRHRYINFEKFVYNIIKL